MAGDRRAAVSPTWRMPRAKISRSSGTRRRAAMAAKRFAADFSPQRSRARRSAPWRASSVKMSAGSRIQPSVKNASTALAPRPSMSKAPRLTKWRSFSTACAGQIRLPVQ